MEKQSSEYRNLHHWIVCKKGKANMCENNPDHKSTRFHWANISGLYKKDVNDFKMLCPSCHKKFDMRIRLRQDGEIINVCKRGHHLSVDNTFIDKKRGYLECRICRRDRKNRWIKNNPEYYKNYIKNKNHKGV